MHILQDVEVYSSPRQEVSNKSTAADGSFLSIIPNTAQIVRSLPGHHPPKLLTDGRYGIVSVHTY